MKGEREPLWPLLIVVGVIAVATFGVSLSIDWWGNTVYRSALVTALVLMVVADIQMIRDFRRKKAAGVAKSDERLDKITVYASAHSFRVGILFIIAMIFVHLSKIFTTDAVTALSVSVFVMAGTFFAFYWYYNRKGDVH